MKLQTEIGNVFCNEVLQDFVTPSQAKAKEKAIQQNQLNRL